jgi:tetratricopeptide (TPR) repeat protein
MKRSAWCVATAALAALWCSSPAWSQNRSFTDRTVPGMQQADRHNPFSRNYTDMTPGGYARRQFGGYAGRPGGTYYFNGPAWYGYYGSGYHGPYGHGNYNHYHGHQHGHYDHYHGPWEYDFGYDYLPPLYPLVIPSETMFGPGAAWNRLGIAPQAAPPANNIIVAPPANNIIVAPPKEPAEKALPQVNAETLARAGRMLDTGDDHFAGQRYREANERYRTATETAPTMVEAYFRQGQALVAIGQYDLAAKAFKRGLKLGPHWKDARFDLAELYGVNELAKSNHIEALAAAAGASPHDGHLLLLVGLELYFDDQVERARPFLERASGILADRSLHLDAVLRQEAPAAEER